jgi:hypothetical protein
MQPPTSDTACEPIFPGIIRIYTPHHTAHLSYPCITARLHFTVHLPHSCISVHPPLLPSAKLSGGGGEQWIFPPHRQPAVYTSIGLYTYVNELTIDDIGLHIALGSMGSLI